MKTSIMALILLLGAFYGQAQDKTGCTPVIIAHRGDSYHAPENTLASAKLGWEHGADAVEIDIYLTSDNRVMVIHDSSTKRTAGRSYKVAETSADTLRTLDVGKWKGDRFAGEKIPYLEEIINAIPAGKKLVIEIKCNTDVLPYLRKTFLATGKTEQCMIISFRYNVVAEAKKMFPAIPVYFLADSISPGKMDEMAGKLKDDGLDGLDMCYSGITPEIADYCTQHNITLYAWTVDDPAIARKLIKMGVRGITTNKPMELRNSIEK